MIVPAATAAAQDVRYTPADSQGRHNYLIAFSEPGMFHASSVRSPGQRFDASSPAVAAYRDQLRAQQTAYRQAIAGAIGRELEVSHHFLVTHSGLAARLKPEEAKRVASVPGVVSVERERSYELDTYRGPEFIGAGAIWDGSAVPDESELRGEDMVIAVIDTGIDPDHPSFANDPSCGHGDGGTPDKLLSYLDCHTTDGAGVCNGPTPEDGNGHGSHTASTAGGNALDASAVPAPPIDITGVAPCAHILSYRACGPGSSCDGAALFAALNNVLESDADVMNYSISGGIDPWSAGDGDRIKLDLVEAGIFVAASAGNTGPTIPDPVGQVNHRGPWVLSVAASTHDGMFANPLSLDGGPSDVPAIEGTGSALADDFTGPLRWAGDADPGNENGCSAFPGGAFTGQAALIERGDCNFSVKVDNAVAAGAAFVVVYNNVGGPPIIMGGLEGTTVSSFMVTDTGGADLIDALNGTTADMTVLADGAFSFDAGLADVLAGFSLRGPTPAPLQHLQKPDITGPGVEILAAVPNGYDFISGTSMSSPHLAGSAALVRQAHPDWTVSEVKSAIQMTASRSGLKDDGAAPWDWDDVGSGRVDLAQAALAGLVMDETIANYLAANPSGGSLDVRDLNLAAVRNLDCTPSCTWTRTVRNTLDVSTSWTVAGGSFNSGFDVEISPADFAFTGGLAETQELTITVTPVGNQTTAISFGEVVLTEIGDESPDLHFTVAIRGQGAVPPTIEVDPDSLGFLVEQDDTDTQTLTIGNLGTEDLEWSIEESEAPAGVRGGDIVVFDNVNFVPNADGIGGSVQWHTGDTCQCDSSPFNFNAYVIGGNLAFFWPTTLGTRGGVSLDGGATVAVLQPGDAVGPGNDYNFGTGAAPAANWRDAGGVDGYLGFRFENPDQGGAVNYGYARITTTGETGFPVTIVGWAYNQAGDPITIPEEGEPASCEDVTDIPWLSVSPDSGTTGGPGSDDVDVTVDSSGLALGDYEAQLCIASNDPANPIVLVPVSLTVTDEIAQPPVIEVDPDSFSVTLETDDTADEDLTISNVGDGTLNWEFVEDAGRISRASGPATLPRTTVPAGAASLSGAIGTSGRAAYEFPAVPRGATTITHSDALDIVAQNAVACSPDKGVTTSANQFLRTFTLSDFGIDDDFHVDEVVFGIENLSATASITVNLYTLDGAFTYANLTQIGSATESLASQTLSLVTVPVTGTAPAGSTLVVEIEAPDLSGTAAFFPGSNSAGESAPSYIAASGCGLDDPSAFGDIGFPQVQLVMTVTGQVAGPACTMPEWVSVDPVSGSTNAGDSSNVQVTFDAGGLAEGVYEGSLCISSDDPADSLLAIPLSMTVTESQPEPGELAVTPAALAFGEVAIGGGSVMSVEVSNAAEAGAESLTLSEIDRTGDAEFQITGGDCAVDTELESGESCTVEVTFVPGGESAFTGEVTIATADGQSAAVGLSGNGVELPDDIFADRFEE